ncbi:MAG: EF-P beta-lysylation protein EpmB [Gammaproteobacteria bacterium]|nr:EF-P beta-lysylation protein EpmB [Gammaproteobacteria bacterium]
MIPTNPDAGEPGPWAPGIWRHQLKTAIRDSVTLCEKLGLPTGGLDDAPVFPVRVPEAWLRRIRHGNPDDPLLRQVLATALERLAIDGFVADAVAETSRFVAPALIQKYDHRALLIASTACPVHCRYCFRREFPYTDHGPAQLDHAIARVVEDTTLSEIILSGGDPLTLTDTALAKLLRRINAIPHLRRIRIHSRWPVAIPERITAELLQSFARSSKPVVLVVHCNHPAELDTHTARAFALLRKTGLTLLNQTVLLRGINDAVTTLAHLSEALFEQGVLPYYLHLLDRVRGTGHFEVEEDRGRALISGLRNQLPGYLVPRLMREIPGEPAKTLIG